MTDHATPDCAAEFRCECGSTEFVATDLGIACAECPIVYEDDGGWEEQEDGRQ